LGATLGYGWSKLDYQYATFPSTEFNAQGIEGGILGGYNFQTGNFVYGVEGDFTFMDLSRHVLRDTVPCIDEGCSAKVDWYGTLRGRLGYSIGNLMPFITGGLAVGRVKGNADLGACDFVSHCGFKDTRAGWTLGAGTEWKINSKWSLKAEYLYVNLGKPHFNESSVTTNNIAFSNARLGISYHF
jgi:outer membrane immunogenic protein